MSSQQRFGHGYGQNLCQSRGVEAQFERLNVCLTMGKNGHMASPYYQSAANTRSAQIWCVFRQIDRSQPLHDAMVRPVHDLGHVVLIVWTWTSFHTGRIETIET